ALGPLGPGPGYNFEPWLKKHPEEVEGAARHWMGVHMVLDMNPYLSHHPAVVHGLKLLGEFGWNQADCQWLPFWKAEKEKIFSCQPGAGERVYASAYRRPGKALVVILNDTPEDKTVAWFFSRKLKVKKVVDAEAPEKEIRVAGKSCQVKVAHFNYRVLLAELE
ncbi:MAG TPA: hypothetical protein PKW42_08105, partial [bacterium]|nr:hypothetical protein [bacterium]